MWCQVTAFVYKMIAKGSSPFLTVWSWPSSVQRSVITKVFTLLWSEENGNQLECHYGGYMIEWLIVFWTLIKVADLLFRLEIISNTVLFSPLCYMLAGVCFALCMTAELKAFLKMFDLNLESYFTLGRKNSFILQLVVTYTKMKNAVHRIYGILWYYKAEINPDSAATAICSVAQGKDNKPSLRPILLDSTRVANREMVPLFNVPLWVFSETGKSMWVYQYGVECAGYPAVY